MSCPTPTWAVCQAVVLAATVAVATTALAGDRVTALGLLEPRGGVVRVAGPSHSSVVIAELLVDEGVRVSQGQILAILDSFPIYRANVTRLEGELERARNEQRRYRELSRDGIVSASERETWETRASSLAADLEAARVQLDWTQVRAPIDGQVLEVHARAGEKVGPEGIVEIGRTQEMFAVAEVYETDIAKLAVGQSATVRSAAFAEPLTGTVERIGMKVGRMEVLSTDPAAQADARVVKVEIRLDDSDRVAALTNLQVEVSIGP